MDNKKELILKDFIKLAANTKGEDMLPLLLAFKDKAAAENIEFTKDDIENIFLNMEGALYCEELEKAEKIMSILRH